MRARRCGRRHPQSTCVCVACRAARRGIDVAAVGRSHTAALADSDAWRPDVPTRPVWGEPDTAAQIAAEVHGFDPLNWIEKKEVKKMDLFIQYAIAAAQFAST